MPTASVATYAWTKLYTRQFLVFISVIDCLWVAYCWWSVAARSKLPCVRQRQSSTLRITDAKLWQYSLHLLSACTEHKLDLRNIKAYLKFTVYQTDRQTHTHFRNAVTLVWGSLRLAPITVELSPYFITASTISWLPDHSSIEPHLERFSLLKTARIMAISLHSNVNSCKNGKCWKQNVKNPLDSFLCNFWL